MKMDSIPGGTVFNPSPAEVLANNRNKQQRREHKQMIEDLKDIESRISILERSARLHAKSIRKSRGKY